MYDENFNLIIEHILISEGGYNNDKNDRGGKTNFGITQDTYNSWNKRNNRQLKDVKKISKEEAKEIYYHDYWLPSGANK